MYINLKYVFENITSGLVIHIKKRKGAARILDLPTLNFKVISLDGYSNVIVFNLEQAIPLDVLRRSYMHIYISVYKH